MGGEEGATHSREGRAGRDGRVDNTELKRVKCHVEFACIEFFKHLRTIKGASDRKLSL